MNGDADPGPAAPGRLVLLVEDEIQVRRFLRASLVGRGFRLLEATRGEEGLRLAAEHLPDVVLLDLGLPDMDGLEVTRRLREWSGVPLIVISARGKEAQKVEALDAGADDYLTKPFGMRELNARIRAALRREARAGPGKAESVFAAGDLRVDLAARTVRLAGEPVHLTPLEYRVVAVLVRHAGRVVTHRQLLREVWGPSTPGDAHYLRVHMTRIRHKLERDPARPRRFLTEAGVGYRLEPDEADPPAPGG